MNSSGDLLIIGSDIICGAAEEYSLTRFVLILAASNFAVLGVAANLLLCYIFALKVFVDTPPTVYPTVLSVLDSILCAVYLLLFTVDVIANYLAIYNLFVVYHAYIVPVFTLAKMVQFAIPYMLILATLERYAWISKNWAHFGLFRRHGRATSAAFCVLISVLVRLPPFFAMTVEEYPNCDDLLRTLSIELLPWVSESFWYKSYEFYVVVVVQMALPFLVLIALNVLIILRLRSTSRDTTGSLSRKMSPVLRNAVHTMVAIATSYLTCSALQLAIIILESNNSSLLRLEEDPQKASTFYSTFGDVISFLYMFTSAFRIAIYCFCNPTIRRSVCETLSITRSHGNARNADQFASKRLISNEQG